jgi:hypothetical protein
MLKVTDGSLITTEQGLRAQLSHAELALTAAESRDYRRSNPRRVFSEIKAARTASERVEFWRWAVTAHADAAAAGLIFGVDPVSTAIALLAGPDGRLWPVSRNSFSATLASLSSPAAYAQFAEGKDRARRETAVRISELHKMLPGASRTGFRRAVLETGGFVQDGRLTPAGVKTGFFTENSGTYGFYFSATPAGLRYIYHDLYLADSLPMSKGATPVRVQAIEERLSEIGLVPLQSGLG